MINYKTNNMKKILFLSAFLMVAGLVSAQTCTKAPGKACCSKTASAAVQTEGGTQVASVIAEAEAVASTDESIIKTVNEVDGFVSFQRKSVCAMSGAVKMENVNFDPATKSFVSAEGQSVQSEVDARSINAATEAATEGVEKPKCCAKGAKSSCQKSAEQK
jgi:hypothetical protein